MKLVQDIKATNSMDNVMVKENSSIKMEDTMKANGGPIKCMVGESFIMKEENSHIKAIGLKTSSMDLGKSTMTILFSFNVVLTLLILTFFKITGNIMKECLSKTQNRAEEK
jgi:hypothetical protein